jgi:hypothetical protein
MHKYLPLLVTAVLLVPLFVEAQTATDTGTTSTINTRNLPQTFMLPMGTSTESIEHGQVTVDIGVDRRFSESPQVLAERDLSASNVINTRRLQMYTRHVALTEPIQEMEVGEESISLRTKGPASLFGFIPTQASYNVDTAFSDGEMDNVSITQTSGWWTVLATKPDTESISENIKNSVADARLLSVTQMRAVVLESIVDAINNT